jgi:lipopolysaccharide biosynthesis protein
VEGNPAASVAGRVALHVHVYYPDMLPDILGRLARNRIRPDLFISVPSNAAKADVEPLLAGYEGTVARLQVVPNRGRDIGPFLTAFGGDWSDYDVVGHLHTKKSLELNDSTLSFRWSSFLMDNLVGRDHAMADVIVGRLLADPSLGLVFPDDPNVVGWSKNLSFAKELGDRMGLVDYPGEFNFPVGTMFWARADALKPLISLGLQWEDYPVEPLGYDGTMLHAIERLLPFVVASGGFRCAVTNVPGVTR